MSDRKPTTVVTDVNVIGTNSSSIVSVTVRRTSWVWRYRSWNSLSTCTESRIAVGIRKIGIIEAMMCTVLPVPIKSFSNVNHSESEAASTTLMVTMSVSVKAPPDPLLPRSSL